MKPSRIWIVVVLTAFAGCSDPETFENRHMELAQSGAWAPDVNAVAMANAYPIGYTGAGPWVGEDGCSGSFTSGARVLKDWVLANWPQVTSVGGYSCRPIVGNSSSMSVHATGRAIDIMLPTDGGSADNGLGDPLANYLIEHADEMGIQMVIWDRWLWSPSRSPRSRAYTGSHPHHDHLHVEITPQASRMETPWYQGGMTAPQATSCDPVPASGRVIDESDSCFVAFGPSQYWRRVSDGMNGSLLWTNAFKSATPANWARWNLDIAADGRYVVEYYRTAGYAVFDSTRYRVRAGQTESDVYLDQSAGTSGWEEIGTYSFTAGANQWVSIYDNTPGEVASEQHIVVDAIRVRPVGEPPPVVVDEPDSPDEPPPSSDPVGDDVNGAQPGQYGNPDSDAPLPPKEGYDPGLLGSAHDDEPEIVFDDTPADVHLGGHSCSVAPVSGGGSPLLLLLGVGMLRRRRRVTARRR